VTQQRIRALVEELLRKASVKGPPVPIDQLIRQEEIHILRKKLDDETSGFIYVDPESTAAVIGLNVSHSTTRQRFTLAHELGHFLMHRQEGGQLHVDQKDFFLRFRDKRTRDTWATQEREANAFAAEILMPKTFLERDIKSLKDGVSISDEKAVRAMANRYGVSLQAFLFRLTNLGLLSPSFL
jgi:Zn-dependent peptidase ImmA (M78 family)